MRMCGKVGWEVLYREKLDLWKYEEMRVCYNVFGLDFRF